MTSFSDIAGGYPIHTAGLEKLKSRLHKWTVCWRTQRVIASSKVLWKLRKLRFCAGEKNFPVFKLQQAHPHTGRLGHRIPSLQVAPKMLNITNVQKLTRLLRLETPNFNAFIPHSIEKSSCNFLPSRRKFLALLAYWTTFIHRRTVEIHNTYIQFVADIAICQKYLWQELNKLYTHKTFEWVHIKLSTQLKWNCF